MYLMTKTVSLILVFISVNHAMTLRYKKASQHVYCPLNAPYLDAKNFCVPCNKPGFWNFNEKKCLTCPAGFILDQTTRKCHCPISAPYLDANNSCVPCDNPAVWNPNDKKCLACPAGFILDQTTWKCHCPPEKPHLSAGVCIKCDAPHFWNNEV